MPAEAWTQRAASTSTKVNPITLIKTACMLGNGEMQFNYLDNETLLDAQRHPEKYRSLVVRVAGYSAFFVELCKDVQDEIISRTMLHSTN